MPDGSDVHVLTLGAEPGAVVELLTLGATVHRFEVAGGDGRRRDVVLSQGSVEERLASGDYLGGTIGRYANRIAAGRFELDGRTVEVRTHDRGNSLHGGPDGFDRRVWTVLSHSGSSASLELVSPDGDMGFPGELTVRVHYELVEDDSGVRLTVRHEAETDAPTVVNLTNHAYVNLEGAGSGAVDDHVLSVEADHYTLVDDTGIPLGPEHSPVDGTPFDLRTPSRLGPRVRSDHPQVAAARGIDHNLVLRDGTPGVVRRAATLTSPASGLRLELHTDQPGLQVYTGNFLDGSLRSPAGVAYRQGDGIALEPQLAPDSPNQPTWPSSVLRPGERYTSAIAWHVTASTPLE